jgi:CRP-like cAMP-binding protein
MKTFLSRLLSRTLLTDEEQAAVLALRGTREEVLPQHAFVCGDEEDTTTCLIASGLCARTSLSSLGEQQITAFYMPGDIPDLQRVMVPESASTFAAITSAEVVRIRYSDIRETAIKYPGIAEALWRHTVCDSLILAEWIVNIGRRDARARLAHLFCESAVRSGNASGKSFSFDFPITQRNLADATGLSTVHVNRSMQALKRDHLFEVRGKVAWIDDWDALKAAGEFDIEYLNCKPPVRFNAMN